MATQVSITDALSGYVREMSLREDAVLAELRELTAELPAGAAQQVSPEEGQLLGLLAGLVRARTVVEIGTYTGYATLCLARAVGAGGRVITCDITSRWLDLGRPFWARAGVAERIDVRIAPAARTLADIAPGSVDLVFVDADKTGYPLYYEAALELIHDDGLVVVDNTLYFGRVADPGALDPDTVAVRAFNEALLADERVDISLLPVADGVTLVRKAG
ncbi:O-methyltransferase [Actinophytocola oryzae]|uniref:O-methyltransferase n=1 Tax=Actinophytocola oryzae TaxID=502181 RepID=A0A4R7VG04_9PSEU|nr:class I SAM-dependent methyltransferase [Actinophytocola oryzae]TDV47989.1 O-methyltransferase [Actinophytocola oryzae]